MGCGNPQRDEQTVFQILAVVAIMVGYLHQLSPGWRHEEERMQEGQRGWAFGTMGGSAGACVCAQGRSLRALRIVS